MREREVKLEVPPAFRMPAMDEPAARHGLTVASAGSRRYRTLYLDTEDLRLLRAGLSLRHRSDEAWTLKLPVAEGGDTLVREELTFDGRATALPAEALDLLTAYVRSAPLREVVRMQTRRVIAELRFATGEVAAELVDDRVSVMGGRRVIGRFREIEIEIESGVGLPPAAMRDLVAVLRAAGAGEPVPTPKSVRALGPAAGRPHELAVPAPGPRSSVGEVVRAALAASVDRLIRHDIVIRLGDDPEGVHQARVAVRRMRSDLRTFADALEPEWSAALRTDLHWLGGTLGEVRDADVLLARLRARARGIRRTRASTAVLGRLEASGSEARSAMLEAIRSSRYADVLDALVAAALDPRFTRAASVPAASALPALWAARWEVLRRHVRELPRTPADADLHRARILTKRARYAAEAFEPVLGKPAARFAKAAAGLQDVLGEHQDSVVAFEWLANAAQGATPAQAFAAGQLAGLERVAAAAARSRWRDAWRTLAKRAP